MNCTPVYAGLADCGRLLKKVNGVMITDKGTEYTDTTFVTESVIKLGIASLTTALRNATVLPFINYERTTDDPSIQTSNLGIKDKDLDPAPSMQGWLDMSLCDYKTIHELEGIWFDVVLFTTDGLQFGTKKSDGAVKGFRCKIATRKDLPPSDNSQSSFPVDFYFRNADEFKNIMVFDPDYNFADVLDFVPVGLGLSITTAYAAGDVVLQVNERCTNTGKTGLVLADFEILQSNGAPIVAVTVLVEDGLGQYTLTIKADSAGTPANIASGKFYTMQASADDATFATYLSNVIKETV